MEPMVDNITALAVQLRSTDEEQRRSAVLALAGYPLEEAKDFFFIGMGDESWRVRKEAVDALLKSRIDEKITEEIVDLLASHDNAGLRNSAVEALQRLGSLAVPVLCRHGEDSDDDVRKFVLDILGNIGDSAAVPVLVRALDASEPNVSAAAAENLGKIGDAGAVPFLVQSLEKTDIWLRYTILEALGRIGRPVPMAAISPLAGENLLKKAVFDCLGAIGDREAVPLLLEGIRERVRNAREAAVVALMKVRGRLPGEEEIRLVDRKLAEMSGAPLVEGLLASLDTSDRGLREALVRMLGLIGDERASWGLLEACRDDRLAGCAMQALRGMGEKAASAIKGFYPGADNDGRCIISSICGELRFPGCGPLLADGMRSENPLLRRVSVVAAGRYGDPGLIVDIVPLLEDNDAEVREGAIEALSSLAVADGGAVHGVAIALSDDGNPEKRRNSARLFAALGDGDRLSLLIKDEDATVRRNAVNALASLKKGSCGGNLMMALVDEDADVRAAVAEALGESGGDEVVAPLLLVLKDEDPAVRCAALKSLGRLRPAEARQAIVDLLDSPADGLLTISALNTLAEIDGEGASETVKKALANPDEEVVKTAMEILSRFGDGWLDEYRDMLLSHSHWDVRRNFIRTMSENRGAEAVPYLESALETESDDLVKEQILNILDRLK